LPPQLKCQSQQYGIESTIQRRHIREKAIQINPKENSLTIGMLKFMEKNKLSKHRVGQMENERYAASNLKRVREYFNLLEKFIKEKHPIQKYLEHG
jgi:hypothetical protein